ncbi:MAG: hypothetical protein ACYTBJ_23085, partial [Planctomycetota bacterium]
MKKRMFTTILCLLALAAGSAGKLGDESDGSRARPVHLIRLFDESKAAIGAVDEQPQPFSTRQTCSKCHTYEAISAGWHFNYIDSNIPGGRAGQPWILVDTAIGTQVPVSYRRWPGAFRPEQLGLSPWGFVQQFGRHTPGGGAGELESDRPDEVMRQFISGKLEINCLKINCLICHNGDSGQDQAEYAGQIGRQNFRWAAAAACEFASVKGSAAGQPDTYNHLMSDAIAVSYRKGTFDEKNQVLLDIVREVPNERCYF